jgi:hypothetical protein
MAYSG